MRTKRPGGVINLDLLAELVVDDGVLAFERDLQLRLLDLDNQVAALCAWRDGYRDGDVLQGLLPLVRQCCRRARDLSV